MEYTSILSATFSPLVLLFAGAIAIRRSSFCHFGTRGTLRRGSTIPTGIFGDPPTETTDETRHDSIPIVGAIEKEGERREENVKKERKTE